jgi:hypothetical protein
MRPSFLFKETNKFLEQLQGNYKSTVYIEKAPDMGGAMPGQLG